MAKYSTNELFSDSDEEDHYPIHFRIKRTRRDGASTSNPRHRIAASPGGRVSMSLADPDLLDCPICFQPLSSPVYQCEHGHLACASCCTKLPNKKCPNCGLPVGNIRNRAMEKVLESVAAVCRNKYYGCREKLNYGNKLAHEKACSYGPCSCPNIGCGFVGHSKLLYNHFTLKHKASNSKQFYLNSVVSISLDSSQNHVILKERTECLLFVLSRCVETLGSFFNLACVVPSASGKKFVYDLKASAGEHSIKLKSAVEMVSKWAQQTPAQMRLFVPSNFGSTSQVLNLELTIRRKHV